MEKRFDSEENGRSKKVIIILEMLDYTYKYFPFIKKSTEIMRNLKKSTKIDNSQKIINVYSVKEEKRKRKQREKERKKKLICKL